MRASTTKNTPGTASDLPAGLQLGEHVDLAVAIGHAFHGFDELAVLKRFQALVDLAREAEGADW